MFDGLPSESIWRRRVLYLGEGLFVGVGGAYILLSSVGLLATFAEGPPRIGMVLFLLVFVVIISRYLWALRVDRAAGFSRPKSAIGEDWSAIRRWGWVALASVLAGGLLFGVSLSVWGWEAVLYYDGGLEVFTLAVLLGLGLLLFGLYDRRDSE